ncbi:MAG: AAA family ATPase [Armatimonadota bacterium]|nr:AAA family ATPase [Armatimonadota bacterium]
MTESCASGRSDGADLSAFVVTKEHRRFEEFCEACRRDRYIGLCYGPPGVGKPLSARRYANWDVVEGFDAFAQFCRVPAREVAGSHAVLYTPPVANTPGRVDRDIKELRLRLKETAYAQRRFRRQDGTGAEEHKTEGHRTEGKGEVPDAQEPSDQEPSDADKACDAQGRWVEDPTDLILVDEADRLRMASLEQLRDVFDRGHLGLVLIGMPGLERRLSRYAQLYSRVGFVHAYRPLGETEMRFLLQQRWRQMGLVTGEGEPREDRAEDFTDAEAMAAVIRVTGGNWRLLHRLMAQVERLLQINELHTITKEVVEAARENLIIGQV